MHCLLIVLAAAVFGGAHAQVFFRGECPNPTLQANFDVSRYTGLWYEFENYFAVFEVGQKCVTAEYTLAAGNSITVKNKGYSYLTRRFVEVIGDAVGTDPSNPAKLGVSFSTSPNPSRGDYWVVATDYDDYSVVWSCNEWRVPLLGKWNAQILWILTRSPQGITSETKDNLYSMLRGFGISTDSLRSTSQDCPV